MLLSTERQIKKAGEHLGLSKEDIKFILQTDHEHIFDIALGGKTHKAYRIQHKNLLGPYKGGIRFHPAVDLNEVKALSILMSLKTAAMGLPLGGGKGGVAIDPRNLSDSDVEKLSRAYVQHLHPHIGPDVDIPAPDVNINPQIIDWMVDEYENITGDTSKASFTGKSIGNEGSLGRESATGRGGMIALSEYLRLVNKDARDLTVAVQGVGNVGFFFTKFAETELNARIVAVSDSKRTLAVKDFTNNNTILSLEGYTTHRKGLIDDLAAPQAEFFGRDAILELPVDILVLAALGDVVTEKNAHSIKASIMLELANGPVNDNAFKILTESNKVIIPDIIANSGGVIVSYLEWLQNKSKEKWSEEEVNKELAEYMTASIQEIYNYSQKHNLSMKETAFILGVKRIISARELTSLKYRG